jgi:NAD-dependent deacetylase
MDAASHTDAVGQIARVWCEAESVVVLTGAGISTASGIPDFRSPGGRWERYQPVSIQDFLASEEARREYWRYKSDTWQLISSAQPNPAHRALAELGRANRVHLLVTQNVDGLHERSGFPTDRLVNIHGTDSRVQCVSCGKEDPRQVGQELFDSGQQVPLCGCGGPLKPATISFGQSLVEADLHRCFREAERCDFFVAVGSSLVVSPINQLFAEAKSAGARCAILTASETPFDDAADWKLAEPLESTLPMLGERVLAS